MNKKRVLVFPGPGPLLGHRPCPWPPSLAPNLYLPKICIYLLSPGPELSYTDLVTPICIYWP